MRHTAIQALVLAAAIAATSPALGQGLSDEGAIDTIIGTEVGEAESDAAVDAEKVIAAIENSMENQSIVRRTTRLEKLDIVYLPDASIIEGGPPEEIQAKVEEHRDEINALRQEIEGNAMLYHAVNSRQILVRDILAIEFDEEGVVIYAAAAPPG